MMGGNESVGDLAIGREESHDSRVRLHGEGRQTYRYRVRIVVFNPNKGREDVSPAVDTKADELRGPWSEATDAGHHAPGRHAVCDGDVTSEPRERHEGAVSGHPLPSRRRRDRPPQFRRRPGRGHRRARTADIPVSDGTGKKSKTIDFNSRQIVLDVFANKKTGGYQQLPAGFIGPPIARPALALLLRPDGSVVLHNEADDEANEVRRDIDANYKHEINQSTKKRESSTGMGIDGTHDGWRNGRRWWHGSIIGTFSASSCSHKRSKHGLDAEHVHRLNPHDCVGVFCCIRSTPGK